MSSNSSGKIFNFNTWGESHGKAIGCVVDGVPSKIELSEEDIQMYLILKHRAHLIFYHELCH